MMLKRHQVEKADKKWRNITNGGLRGRTE